MRRREDVCPVHCPGLHLFPGIDRPASLFQYDVRFGRSGHGVDDLTVWSAEVTRNIAAILLDVAVDVPDFKVADLLMAGDEILCDKVCDVLVRQSTCSVFLGVVSGEARFLEVTRHMHHENQLVLVASQLPRLVRRVGPGNLCPQRSLDGSLRRSAALSGLAIRRRLTRDRAAGQIERYRLRGSHLETSECWPGHDRMSQCVRQFELWRSCRLIRRRNCCGFDSEAGTGLRQYRC